MLIFLIGLLASNAHSSPLLKEKLDTQSEKFFQFPKVIQTIHNLKAKAITSKTAVKDRGLTISFDFSESRRPELGQTNLLRASGLQDTSSRRVDSRVIVAARNLGVMNSTQLELSAGMAQYDWQKADPSLDPIDSAKSVSARLSYDVVQGGYRNPAYLANKAIEKSELSAMMGYTSELVANYLEYRSVILDIYAYHCRLKTAEADLAVIKKVAGELQLAYQLRSMNYKQYLNIIDTQNFVERNKINYELAYQVSLNKIWQWLDVPLEDWERQFKASMTCPTSDKEIENLISSEDLNAPQYRETILSQRTRATSEAFQYSYLLAKQQIRPSVRPYVEVAQEDSLGFNNQKVSVGVSLYWDTPSEKNRGTVQGTSYDYEASVIANRTNEMYFNSEIKSLLTSFQKNKEILLLSIASLKNSNSLVKLLEVQKSIGQIDSVSLSNAYTQRNQILSSVFDSIISLEKSRQEIYYIKHWPDLLKGAGIVLK